MMIRNLSRRELEDLIQGGRAFKLVDVLSKEHYEEEHIKGAISLPLEEIEQRAKDVLRDKNEMIVVYCASFDCPASTKAASKLMSLGYTNVFDYKGGLKDYKETDLPLESSKHAGAQKVTSGCATC